MHGVHFCRLAVWPILSNESSHTILSIVIQLTTTMMAVVQRRPEMRLSDFVLLVTSLIIVANQSLSFELSRAAVRRSYSSQQRRLELSLRAVDKGLVYEEPVFRPPAEWQSLILQVTIGCSWNKCTFCEMYQEKQFRYKPIEKFETELQQVASTGRCVRDVFLADGDAMTLPTKHLLKILN